MQILVSLLSQSQITHIRSAFSLFDADFSGTISRDEFMNALIKSGQKLLQSEVNSLFENVKFKKDKEITYTSFLYASLDSSLLNEASLKNVFQFMDSSGTGRLSVEDLKKSLIRRGHIFSAQSREALTVEEIITSAGIKYEEGAFINFIEFCGIMGVETTINLEEA